MAMDKNFVFSFIERELVKKIYGAIELKIENGKIVCVMVKKTHKDEIDFT